jgi:hypothetical protein
MNYTPVLPGCFESVPRKFSYLTKKNKQQQNHIIVSCSPEMRYQIMLSLVHKLRGNLLVCAIKGEKIGKGAQSMVQWGYVNELSLAFFPTKSITPQTKFIRDYNGTLVSVLEFTKFRYSDERAFSAFCLLRPRFGRGIIYLASYSIVGDGSSYEVDTIDLDNCPIVVKTTPMEEEEEDSIEEASNALVSLKRPRGVMDEEEEIKQQIAKVNEESQKLNQRLTEILQKKEKTEQLQHIATILAGYVISHLEERYELTPDDTAEVLNLANGKINTHFHI